MKANKGFSLLEILGVLAIMAILIGIAAGPTLAMIERARQDAEVRTLQRMATDIESSFQSSDLNNINISALPGETEDTSGGAVTGNPWLTTFDFPAPGGGFPDAHYDGDGFPQITLVTNAWWFYRFARIRGAPVPDLGAGGVTRGGNPAMYDLITNIYNRPRFLVAEPNTVNKTTQRYMLITIMAPAHYNLPIAPGGSSEDWFEQTWGNDFDGGSVPDLWKSAGGGDWNEKNARRVKVVRITQPRFQLTINNTSKTDAGYIYYNGRTKDNAPLAGPNARIFYVNSTTPVIPVKIPLVDTNGVWQGQGILGGRRILINRGGSPSASVSDALSQSSAMTVFDFNLNETTTITIQ